MHLVILTSMTLRKKCNKLNFSIPQLVRNFQFLTSCWTHFSPTLHAIPVHTSCQFWIHYHFGRFAVPVQIPFESQKLYHSLTNASSLQHKISYAKILFCNGSHVSNTSQNNNKNNNTTHNTTSSRTNNQKKKNGSLCRFLPG